MAAVHLGFKTSPQDVDWATLDATWALAAELDVFESAWMNDHLTDLSASGGPSLESLTLAAALAHRVPGKWVGHAVLSNTFRHPALLAKAATVMDHVTGGRFILGLGAGWHEGEHRAFGIPLPPIGERIDRLASALEVLTALFSPAAGRPPGVTHADAFYPLERAVNLPAPLTPGGPPIWLGGQKPRGIALAARFGRGWLLPGVNAGDVSYFRARRDELRRALAVAGREAEGFAFAAQVHVGSSKADLASARQAAVDLARAGATHVIIGIRAGGGPAALADAAEEVAAPVREAVA
jgi:alkanesulfonate monooxygenase SsuD/methylene tetrahydromethanopterin reductase-like flavin-dependent oxidoreductase (luciferase family)